MSEMSAVGTEEGGVVREAAGNAGDACRFTSLYHGAGGHQSLDGNILPQGRTCCLLKDATDLGSTAVESICY